ncbi:serine/threonine-protein kinase [Actinocorallia populi]|uniref:serine/threonine-protein kinase n=1 Tax=Actinocorallia populi TaxID=2079200 RepID=UPI0018E58870|nr:serine/threonine-protein kinase [Actinocorallia populi]
MQAKIAGRYAVLHSLGTHLHLAYDERTGGQAFLREVPLPPELADDERSTLAEHVIREAAAASRVRHPAIVPVLDAVLHEGKPWIVTPPINGQPLTACFGALSPQQTAALGADLAGALSAAHTLGVLHGDVQPANVWLTPDGRGLLTGFGTGVSARSQAASSIGTPGFAAPEKTTNPVPSSDLWSLGATLYLAVEGVPPFPGNSPMEVLSAVLSAEPRPPEKAGDLGPVLLALLAKDPAQRPAEVEDDLVRLARPASGENRTVAMRPRTFALLAACAAVAIASVTATATALLTAPEAPVSFKKPATATDPGKFGTSPRACDLLTDAQAGELVPDFDRQEYTPSGLPLGAQCTLSNDKLTVKIELSHYKPGPLGGGPETAREFLAGLKADATREGSSSRTVSQVRDLPEAGEQGIAYNEQRTDGSRYIGHAAVAVSNLAATIECAKEDVEEAEKDRVTQELGSCAEKTAGWLGESLKRTG